MKHVISTKRYVIITKVCQTEGIQEHHVAVHVAVTACSLDCLVADFIYHRDYHVAMTAVTARIA